MTSNLNFFGNRKNKISVIVLLFLLLAIPFTVWLLQKAQIFAPKAESDAIELVSDDGSCVVSTNPNKVTCATFPIKLTSPLGPDDSVEPSATASSSASPTASASASLLPSSSPSSTPSASPTNIASCMSTKLGLGAPLSAANKNNTTLLYWKSIVTLAQLKSAASDCGARLLKPDNFTTPVIETLVRGASGGTIRSVLVEGPCSDTKVNEYRTNGIKVSADVQCNPPDVELDYKVYPSANTFDGIGDFGGSGDPAVVIPASGQAFNLKKLFENVNIFKNAYAQFTCASPPVCSAGQTLIHGDPPAGQSCPIYQCITNSPSTSPSVTPSPHIEPGATCTADNQCGQGQECFNFENFPGTCKPSDTVCAQVITGACGPVPPDQVKCVDFPTPCHIPPGWSVQPASSPSPLAHPWTIAYKVAETEDGLVNAPIYPYDAHPKFTSFTFLDSTPGAKQIWVEFFGPNNNSKKEHISVELVEPPPVITSLDCSMDISKQNLKLTLNGSKLGVSGGKVTANSKDVKIITWNNDQVTATLKPEQTLEDGQSFKVQLTKVDAKVLPEVVCEVNTSLISLGARLFCRVPGKFDVQGVKIALVDEQGNKVNEEVTIDTDGLIKGLKTKLQVGKSYVLSVKAPNSLRKNVEFTASHGTSVVTPEHDEVFILPIGDIAPVILNDGKINTPDRAEIVRQWSLLGGEAKSGDFNRDSRINSVDWACMRYDFNKEDESVPVKARGVASGSSPAPVQTPSPVSSGAVSPTPLPSTSGSSSPSPLPSGSQRSAFFLLEPLEGGTYRNGDEFIVDVNIWSQKEEANLFVAKIAFDPAALEVVSIEKGSALTSWAEEFYDNQTGRISLVAGRPSPGLKTTQGNDPRLARIILRAKNIGLTDIRLTSDSKIYSNSDNINILTSLLSAQIAITN